MYQLTPNLTLVYDYLWEKISKKLNVGTILELCKLLHGQARIRATPWRRLPLELREMNSWGLVYSKYKAYLPDYHNAVDYLVRSFFKVLYGSEARYMNRWYVKKLGPQKYVTRNLITGIKRAAKGSVGRRALEAVLHSSFTLDEIRPVLEKEKDILEDMNAVKEREEVNDVEGHVEDGTGGDVEGEGTEATGGGKDDIEDEDLLKFDEFSKSLDKKLNRRDIEGGLFSDIFRNDARTADDRDDYEDSGRPSQVVEQSLANEHGVEGDVANDLTEPSTDVT